MKLIENTLNGRRYGHWTRSEAIAYFLRGVSCKLMIASSFFSKMLDKETAYRQSKQQKEALTQLFLQRWLKHDGEKSYFDFEICKLPDVSDSPKELSLLISIFEDVLMFPCFLNDNYDKKIVEYFDLHMGEGPYGYRDGNFDVSVKKDDVVIDAGAWLGDFSAYAAAKGATAYAFEPVKETFQWICITKELNEVNAGRGKIIPIPKGLGDSECEMSISINKDNSGSNSTITKGNSAGEKISITTLDKFVEENDLKRVDFIKADIEGAERNMLKGATNVLKTFAPKLAICTYHLPDDPYILGKIILDANPDYTVIHLRHKLMAAVVK
jgi:FkbM family methyltransferase